MRFPPLNVPGPPDPRTAPITDQVSGWYARARRALRGVPLLLLGTPMALDALTELGRGRGTHLLAAAGSTALVVGAMLVVRGGQSRRAAWRAGVMMGLASALAAWAGAGYAPGISVAFGLIAGFGTVFAYGPAKQAVLPSVAEMVPPAPPPPPPPPDPEAEAFSALEHRVVALGVMPRSLPAGPFGAAVGRIAASARAMLDEARSDPTDFSRIRRFLNVYLDGLETLALRYRNAHPSGGALDPGLAGLLADLERAFDEKLAELRAHDLKALDVEREVLSRRLAEQLSSRLEIPR
jgi:hypothetical protein